MRGLINFVTFCEIFVEYLCDMLFFFKLKVIQYVHLPGGAESDNVICPGARKYASGIIICITIRSRASLLELLRIKCWMTCRRVPMNSSATVFVGVEHIACTPTPNNLPVGLEGELGGASGPQVPVTTSNATVSHTIEGFHSHW